MHQRQAPETQNHPSSADPVSKSCLEGGAPAPPPGPVFPTFGACGPKPAAVTVRHVLRASRKRSETKMAEQIEVLDSNCVGGLSIPIEG